MQFLVDTSFIELLMAPAVLVPSCGLLVMSTSARLSSILARIRDLHRQRLDAFLIPDSDDERQGQVRGLRLEGLEVQTHWLIKRAASTRASLHLIYLSIAVLLLSSGVLGLSLLWKPTEYGAVVLFALGMLLLFGAVVLAVRDVAQSLTWVRYEHERIAKLCGGHTHD